MESTSYQLRQSARRFLQGRWPGAVLVCLIAALLGAGDAVGNTIRFLINDQDQQLPLPILQRMDALWQGVLQMPFGRVLSALFAAISFILASYTLVTIVVGPAVRLGRNRYFLALVRGQQTRLTMVFECFDRFGTAFLMNLISGLLVGIGILLLIVPGIVLSHAYALAPYILADHPGMSAVEALARSRQWMQGQKLRLFCLWLSFLGWQILCLFTLGLGELWLNPYVETATAAFYQELADRMKARAV